MKNWLTIGQFSKKVLLTERTLRVYEAGLIKAHTRGENGYRYFTEDQVEVIHRVKQFKSFGFTLNEIRSLLEIDISMNPTQLEILLQDKLTSLQQQEAHIHSAQNTINKILTSLRNNKKGLDPIERRFIMSQLDKISVVISGTSGLDITAEYIKQHIEKGGKNIPVTIWDGQSSLPKSKPYIVIIPENLLSKKEVSHLSPDIVVIKEISSSSKEIHQAYLQLYKAAGPHMSTILNADDRAVVEFAGNNIVRKGKTYYFSKNSAMQLQISRIGGAVCRGDTVEIFGMNQNPEVIEIQMQRVLGHIEETAYLASLVAVMDIGLKPEMLKE